MAAERVPPHTVRIKRKRGEDPLKALLIDEQGLTSQKRSKTDRYVFRFAGTFEGETQASVREIVLMPQEDETTTAKRVYRMPRTKRKTAPVDEDPEISNSLTDMVQSYLDLESTKDQMQTSPVTKRPSIARPSPGRKPSIPPIEPLDLTIPVIDTDEYVYDIYYRERYADTQLDIANVGVLLLLDSDLEDFGLDEDADSNAPTDDEDSNAEDFYKNDYPDEDSDESFGFSSSASGHGPGIDRLARVPLGNLRDEEWNDEADGDAEEGELEWSEDEDMEEYRDRILANLERQLKAPKKIDDDLEEEL